MKVDIGCNTLYPAGRLRGEETFTVAEQMRALDIIAEAGFRGVEYSHAAPLSPDEMERVAGHARDLGLVSWSVHAWAPLAGDSSQIEPTLAKYRDAARIARTLGTRVIVVHSGGAIDPAGLDARRRANVETLAALAGMAGPDIVVAVENMRSRADWEFIVDVVSRCPASNVGLNIDTGHANLGDLGVVPAIRMAGDRIRTTHLQDNHGRQDDHLPPGRGQIDWVAALTAFREAGYSGMYMVEISDCPPDREPNAVEESRAAARNLRAFLAEAGFQV